MHLSIESLIFELKKFLHDTIDRAESIWRVISYSEILYNLDQLLPILVISIFIISSFRFIFIENLYCNEIIWFTTDRTVFKIYRFLVTLIRVCINSLFYSGLLAIAIVGVMIILTCTLTIGYVIINTFFSFLSCIEDKFFLEAFGFFLMLIFITVLVFIIFWILVFILTKLYLATVESILLTKHLWIKSLVLKIKKNYIQFFGADDVLINRVMFLIGKGILNCKVSVPTCFKKKESYYPQSIENSFKALEILSNGFPMSENKYLRLFIFEYLYFFALNNYQNFTFYNLQQDPIDNIDNHKVLSGLIATMTALLRMTDYPCYIFSYIPDEIINKISSVSTDKRIAFEDCRKDKQIRIYFGEQDATCTVSLLSKEALELLNAYLLMNGNIYFARQLHLNKKFHTSKKG